MSKPKSPSKHAFTNVSPLWSRAPGRDENGKPYIDVMMLIPGLKQGDESTIESHMYRVREALLPFEQDVVYVDLNVKLGSLWVSAQAVPGITKRIVLAVQQEIPLARVVAGDFNPDTIAHGEGKLSWMKRVSQKVKQTLQLTAKSSLD